MKRTIILVLMIVLVFSSSLMAQIIFNDGGTHNIISTINYTDVWVEGLASGMQTTVNLLNGGHIPWPYVLQGLKDSRINISGGSVGQLIASYNSQVTMTRGSVYSIFGAYDNSQVIISGGSVYQFYTTQSGQVTMNGGSVDLLIARDSSQITISGSNFAIDGIPVNFGKITSILGGGEWIEIDRTLTGILANDDIINSQFRIGNSASIILVPVPEPSGLLTLSLLSGMLYFRRKR